MQRAFGGFAHTALQRESTAPGEHVTLVVVATLQVLRMGELEAFLRASKGKTRAAYTPRFPFPRPALLLFCAALATLSEGGIPVGMVYEGVALGMATQGYLCGHEATAAATPHGQRRACGLLSGGAGNPPCKQHALLGGHGGCRPDTKTYKLQTKPMFASRAAGPQNSWSSQGPNSENGKAIFQSWCMARSQQALQAVCEAQ